MQLELKGQLFRTRFLQQSAGSYLMNNGNVYKMLFDALSLSDVQNMCDHNIFFARTLSPSCTSVLVNTPSVDSLQLIIFECDHFSLFSPQERTAILLHEIGHALNPGLEGDENEFIADNFAIDRGYGPYIVSSITYGISRNLIGFEQAINQRRIKRIQNSH
jgi:hypothetical protein